MTRWPHYLWALLITIAVKGTFTWTMLSIVPADRNTVMVNARQHTAEIRQAISGLHIPDLRIVETDQLAHFSLLIAVVGSTTTVVSTLVIFFFALCIVRKAPPKPGQI